MDLRLSPVDYQCSSLVITSRELDPRSDAVNVERSARSTARTSVWRQYWPSLSIALGFWCGLPSGLAGGVLVAGVAGLGVGILWLLVLLVGRKPARKALATITIGVIACAVGLNTFPVSSQVPIAGPARRPPTAAPTSTTPPPSTAPQTTTASTLASVEPVPPPNPKMDGEWAGRRRSA